MNGEIFWAIAEKQVEKIIAIVVLWYNSVFIDVITKQIAYR